MFIKFMKSLDKDTTQLNIDNLAHSWQVIDGKLVLNLTLRDFTDCVKLINKISKVAEKENHHPDLKIYDYKKLLIEIHTHSLDALTQKDFDLAKEIENLLQK
jgi:4a-hydroxytetrahydrobiopterin dehydratase